MYLTHTVKLVVKHVWRSDPPCFQRCNKEYLTPLPNAQFVKQSGDPDGTRSARLQDPLRAGLPRVPPGFSRRDSSPHSDHCGSRQGHHLKECEKAQLVQQRVTYLGLEISGGQRELGPERKEAICRTPEPQTVKELRTFLGMTASFLSGTLDEPVIHDCIETMEATYSSRADLKEEPLEDAEDSWYTDGSSFLQLGQRKAGYAITTTQQVIESQLLPPGTSAQKAEIIALTQALELAKGKRINIWTDSKYAFGVVHAHGAIWKERGLLTAQGKQVKHAEEILRLLEAVQQPERVAIMHCRGHQKGNTDSEIGNRLVIMKPGEWRNQEKRFYP
ncbi:uncharacterized protein LOC115353618 isoform X2 [Aquila chrysaetos chrysaetos]|uniref:uncharacterized protein LOC115353618 isoform X2 n=1 Tax=Aquila chrysaetos chrysaetos TaxID=223781 RepID=UPI001B7D3A19|nr:uncharacterized protein LOC115353618 isoform X2 [Aquila chrysaetos chrysaetos]